MRKWLKENDYMIYTIMGQCICALMLALSKNSIKNYIRFGWENAEMATR